MKKTYIINYAYDALEAITDLESHFCDASQATLEDYYKTGERLIKRKKMHQTLVDVLIKAKSENTFYKWLNGCRFYLCNKIKECLKLYELTSDSWYCEDAYELFDDLQNIANFNKSDFNFDFNKKKSKKTALHKLPKNWQELLINYNRNSKYTSALVVIALTGCRPCELVKGIKISISDEKIDFFIEGAKVDDKKGQPFRNISYPIDSKNTLIEILKNILSTSAKEITISIAKAVNFTVEIRRRSKILWPSHKESITSYCFRHQFSADMKKSKKGDDVSRALGHATDKTRKRYGHASQGRGLITEVTVTVPRPIRKTATRTSEPSSSPS